MATSNLPSNLLNLLFISKMNHPCSINPSPIRITPKRVMKSKDIVRDMSVSHIKLTVNGEL
jgi:hypothetical protein